MHSHCIRQEDSLVRYNISYCINEKEEPSLLSAEERKTFVSLPKMFMERSKKTNSSGRAPPVTELQPSFDVKCQHWEFCSSKATGLGQCKITRLSFNFPSAFPSQIFVCLFTFM